MAKNNPTGDSGQWGYDADILNDSISMNMEDDSFDGNESTLILPSKPVVNPSSSNNPKTGPAHPGQSVPSTSKDPFNGDTVNQQSSPSPEEEQAEEPRSQQSNTTNRDEWMRRELARNRDLENERDWLRGINKMLEASADEMSQIKQKLQGQLLVLYIYIFESNLLTIHPLTVLYKRTSKPPLKLLTIYWIFIPRS
ncbi:hypothetical protein Pst134EA_031667 [Puccinia striiformis f. sp. tritici]|uniref:uncharacterized protein n=1 Tax=Puccinia striiformis f. sp. tritici TaxID=168172 RepID=UPI002008CFB1|nr:uncharacterized protein Pst134EA_031667 [Puccinia striiformis f. sp. tritici]KAH9442698.1 hypothetical protein Pst134EA_031667 [Puccinia striiformis f. sp. tritici]